MTTAPARRVHMLVAATVTDDVVESAVAISAGARVLRKHRAGSTIAG